MSTGMTTGRDQAPSNAVIDVVTGAFSYSGRFVAAQLLERGRGVRTLNKHPKPDDPLAPPTQAYPPNLGAPDAPVAVLRARTPCTTRTGYARRTEVSPTRSRST